MPVGQVDARVIEPRAVDAVVVVGDVRHLCVPSHATCYRPPGNITCACGGWYPVGRRVVSTVDTFPFGLWIGAGRQGTVLAESTSSTRFALLVQWDNRYDGHNRRCQHPTRGSCSDGGSSKYWSACSSVAPLGPWRATFDAIGVR